MNSSISRSAAWLIGPDLDPPWHTVSEGPIRPAADIGEKMKESERRRRGASR